MFKDPSKTRITIPYISNHEGLAGGRGKGLNSSFSLFFVALLNGINRALEDRLEITQVLLTPALVKNEHIYELIDRYFADYETTDGGGLGALSVVLPVEQY